LFKSINIILIFFLSQFLFGQVNSPDNELYIPRNIQQAYSKGTRSIDGTPGRNYWQNYSEYKFDVEVNPSTRYLNGKGNIVYYNNSPDTLNRIILRLYQEIFRKGSARDWPFNVEGLTDGVKISKLLVDNNEIDLNAGSEFRKFGTNAVIELDDLILPNSYVNLTVEWSYYVSTNHLRTGIYDSTSYFIAYWYPEVAVYDDIDGWDMLSYTGTQEFYNDISSFDVRITLPNSFCVWATGELQNPADVLQEKYLNRYKIAVHSDSVIRIVTKDDLESERIFNDDNTKNIWHYKAESTPAFAFAFSDKYLWDGISALIDSASGSRVFIDAAYREESDDFYDVAEIARQVIEFFSFDFPAVSFPYSNQTVFNGGRHGGGMEHPMIINNGTTDSRTSAEALNAHEIAHQYFPFDMGTNERKYAFMDEGWAVFFTIIYQEKSSIDLRHRFEVLVYQNFAGEEAEIPPMMPSNFLTGNSYRIASYTRPALAFYYLRDLLGEEKFNNALQEFCVRWKNKHPIPYDLFFTFNDVTGENLNWYWKPWFFEFGYPDLALDKAIQKDGEINIIVRKPGSFPVPIELKLIYEDDSEEIIYHTASVWKDGDITFEIKFETDKYLKEVILGSDLIPDVDSDNNYILIH
jgi:hypothetical protein